MFYIQGWGQTPTLGLWCRKMGSDVDQPFDIGIPITNVTGIIDYKVATTKSDRKIVVAVLMKTGIRTRFSTDGGLTWGSSKPLTHDFIIDDGVPQGSAAAVRPASFDLIFDGSEFAMSYCTLNSYFVLLLQQLTLTLFFLVLFLNLNSCPSPW
jgi:hypothetical protein